MEPWTLQAAGALDNVVNCALIESKEKRHSILHDPPSDPPLPLSQSQQRGAMWMNYRKFVVQLAALQDRLIKGKPKLADPPCSLEPQTQKNLPYLSERHEHELQFVCAGEIRQVKRGRKWSLTRKHLSLNGHTYLFRVLRLETLLAIYVIQL